MSEATQSLPEVKNTTPIWKFYDLLTPIQMGVIYEMFMLNAVEALSEDRDPAPYMQFALESMFAIDANMGFKEWWEQCHDTCHKLAAQTS